MFNSKKKNFKAKQTCSLQEFKNQIDKKKVNIKL